MAKQWETASKDLGRGFISDWLRTELHDQDLARAALDVLDNSAMSADERLLRVLVKIAPDLPPVWKQWSLAKEDLIAAANAANQGDEACRGLFSILYQRQPDILGIYAQSGNIEFIQIQIDWQTNIVEYEKTWKIVINNGILENLKPDLELVLPALFLGSISPKFYAEIQSESLMKIKSIYQPAWLNQILISSPKISNFLVLRIIASVFPSKIDIYNYIKKLLEEFKNLANIPDFINDLNEFKKNIKSGIYNDLSSIEKAFKTLWEKYDFLAKILQKYNELYEKTPIYSPVYSLLKPWQLKINKLNYAELFQLKEELKRSYRWELMLNNSWQRPTSLAWEFYKEVVQGYKYKYLLESRVALSSSGQFVAVSTRACPQLRDSHEV